MVISTTDSNKNQSKNICYIYRHIRLDTNVVFYIGKGTNTDGKYARAYSFDRTNPHWHNVVNKHGYRVEIIVDNLTEKDAFDNEVKLILHYGRRDLGAGTLVNMTDGGDGASGYIVTEERKKQISEFHKGNKYNLGRKHTQETIEKTLKARSWYKHSKETIAKMRNKKLSDEHIEKLRHINTGNTYGLGYKHTDEARKKISDKQPKKKVGQYKDDVLIKEYSYSKEVKVDGFDPRLVRMCCNGKRKSHGGYEWRFIIDLNDENRVIDFGYGKKHSLETIEKIKNSKKDSFKKVGKFKDGILIKEYPSVHSTALDGYCYKSVSRCCNNHKKTHKGYEWRFL